MHKSIARNSIVYFISQMCLAIFGLTSTILIARIVGPYVTGQYSYLVWIGSIFLAIGTLSIPNALTKFIAEYSENESKSSKIAGNLLLFSLLLGILSSLILVLLTFLRVFPSNMNTIYFYLIAIAIPFNATATCVAAIIRGFRYYDTIMLIGIITGPVMLIVILIVLYFSHSLIALVFYYFASCIIPFITYGIFAYKKIKISFKRLPKDLMRNVFKYFITVSAVMLLDQIVWSNSEVIFLGHFSSPQQVAYYSLSYSVSNSIMTLFPGSILNALMPHVAALQGIKNIKGIAQSYQTSARYVGLIVGALTGGGIALSSPFIYTFYGAHYVQMIPVFRILIFSAGWATIAGITATILYGMTRQGFILKTGLVLSIANILFDFLIIPSYGAIGAAIANGIAQFLGVLAGIYFMTKRVNIPFPILTYVKISIISLLSCVLTLIFVNFVSKNNIWIFLAGGIIYTIIYFYLALINKLIAFDEIKVLHYFQSNKQMI